jgi:hypothetical protein
MLSDSMSSDTLFSTISQFPFPDSREIGELLGGGWGIDGP